MYSRLLACFILCGVTWCTNASGLNMTIKPNTIPVFFIEGKPLSLTCTVHTKAEVEIVWTKMEQELTAEYQLDFWIAEDDQGPSRNVRLTKNSAGQNDASDFRCSAGGTDQLVQTTSFYVYTRDANVTEGALTTLTCKPELPYTDKTVTWFKGSNPLAEVPDLKGRLEFGNDTVSFRNTKLTDSGVYTCRLEIGPSKEKSQVFEENVVLQGKPYITNSNSPVLNQHVTNSTIRLKCPAGGHPVPEVFWFREDQVLEHSGRTRVSVLNGQPAGMLEIINTTEADLGQYSCTAENALGKASMTFDLKYPGLNNSGSKRSLGFWDVSRMALYIYVVAIATSWTR